MKVRFVFNQNNLAFVSLDNRAFSSARRWRESAWGAGAKRIGAFWKFVDFCQSCRFDFNINCICYARLKSWPCWNGQPFSTDKRKQLTLLNCSPNCLFVCFFFFLFCNLLLPGANKFDWFDLIWFVLTGLSKTVLVFGFSRKVWFNSNCYNSPPPPPSPRPGIPPRICHFFVSWRSNSHPRDSQYIIQYKYVFLYKIETTVNFCTILIAKPDGLLKYCKHNIKNHAFLKRIKITASYKFCWK